MTDLGSPTTPKPAPDQGNAGAVDMGVPTNPERSIPFAILAALCGFALIVLPFLSDDLSVGLQPFRWPMIVVGLAAIAAALGSQAVAKGKMYSAGGMAAIVVIFATIFTSPKPSFVYGNLHGTEKFRSVVMQSNNNFVVGRPSDSDHYRFFAREEEIRGPIFSISARNVDGVLPQQIIIGCIKTDLLKKYLGNPDGLALTMSPDGQDSPNPRWKLVQTTTSESVGQFGNPACTTESNSPLKAVSLPSKIRDALVSSAYAMDPKAAPTPPLQGAADVNAIYRGLEQGDFATQVRTQDRVARLRDAPSITAVIHEWKAPWKTHVDTGLLVAWVRNIRVDRALAVPIASALSQTQLDHIVELAGHKDYTVRYNATELLSWMLQSTGWENPPPAAQADAILNTVLRPFIDTQAFFQAPSNDPPPAGHALSAFNAMVALNDAKCVMTVPSRNRASATLTTFVTSPQIQTYKLQNTSAAAGQFQTKQC